MKSNPNIFEKNFKSYTTNDLRVQNVIELLQEAPLDNLEKFLDIGMGQGEVLKWLSKHGKECTGTGLEVKSYGVDIKKLKDEYNITVFECSAEKMPFQDNYFDGIIMSHILEHCLDIQSVLQEVRRVLNDSGWLFIFVPPYDEMVYAGHVSVGWNIGQLMYVLLLNGFNVSHGRFIKYNYNICGFVQKEHRKLPLLRGDKGDIKILNENNFFPLPILTTNNENDTFLGNLNSINWNENSVLLNKLKHPTKITSKIKNLIKNIILTLFRQFPYKLKIFISNSLLQLAYFLKHETYHPKKFYNPKNLKGF